MLSLFDLFLAGEGALDFAGLPGALLLRGGAIMSASSDSARIRGAAVADLDNGGSSGSGFDVFV